MVARSRHSGVSDQRLVGGRIDGDGLLNEAKEQLAAAARAASVEPEGELVEAVVQMFVRDRAVMGAQQPAFEQRHDLMHMGHELSRRLCVATEHGHLMRVAMMLQRVVAGPAISVHEAVRCDGVLNKRRQAGPGGVEETAQPDAAQSAALDFHRNDNQRLGFRLPPAPARVHAPHIGLVHFDPAGEAIAARTHHRPTKLVEPRPGGLVAAQTQRPLQPQGAHPRLLVRHPPHRSEPRHHRRPRVLEDRAGGHRRLVGAGRALPPPSSHGPRLRRPTARAPKPLLAISLAIAAAEAGRRVYYGTLAGLIDSLMDARAAGELSRRLRVLTHPARLVVDEIGYLPVSQDGAVLFFQLINARHARASTVLTSNKGFEEWGHVLGDEIMAAALIDRRLHHCHIVNIRGNSYRMREHQHWLRTASDERREGVAS